MLCGYTTSIWAAVTRKILGVDPSTHCGWAVVSRDGTVDTGIIHVPKDAHKYRIPRYVEIARAVSEVALEYEVEFAVVEGYIHAGKFVNFVQYEIGAIVRCDLWHICIPVVEASPASVKKFATGRGQKVSKKQMVAAAKELWGYEGKDDNQADALALAYMGLVLDGATNVTHEDSVGVVSKLGNPLL